MMDQDLADLVAQEAWIWGEHTRLWHEWCQAIRDLHGREPTETEAIWYLDNQVPRP